MFLVSSVSAAMGRVQAEYAAIVAISGVIFFKLWHLSDLWPDRKLAIRAIGPLPLVSIVCLASARICEEKPKD